MMLNIKFYIVLSSMWERMVNHSCIQFQTFVLRSTISPLGKFNVPSYCTHWSNANEHSNIKLKCLINHRPAGGYSYHHRLYVSLFVTFLAAIILHQSSPNFIAIFVCVRNGNHYAFEYLKGVLSHFVILFRRIFNFLYLIINSF